MQRPFPAYDGPEHYVFVCYAHDDAEVVYPEIVRLRESGFHIWYDEGVSPGSDWSQELAEHIEGCVVFLYFVTPASVEREHCRREVNFALEQQCSILAVHLAQTEVPSALKLSLSNRQAILRYELSASRYADKLATALAHAAAGRSTNIEDEASAIQIGDWLVDPASGRLTNGETESHLQPQSMSVLIYLAGHPDQVVSPDDLLENVWQGRFTGNDSVYQHIGLIRKALGDDAKAPAYIETIPRRGLRLIAPVSHPPPEGFSEPDDSNASLTTASKTATTRQRAGWLSAGSITVLIAVGLGFWILDQLPAPQPTTFDRSVAVLPFMAIGDDRAIQSYASGLSEELESLLTNYQEIRTVNDRAAKPSYTVGATAYAVGNKLRLMVQLVRSLDGQLVWSEVYERGRDDAMASRAIQASTIGRFVRLQLVQDHQCESARQKTASDEAAEFFCAAQAVNYQVNQGGVFDFELQLSNAQKAIELDPNLEDSYFYVADSYLGLVGRGRMEFGEAIHQAHSALDRGLAINSENPKLLFFRGFVEARHDLDYDSAEADLRRAIALDPRHPNARWFHAALGEVETRRGNIVEALDHYRRATSIYDSDGRVYGEYAGVLFVAGKHREAIEAANAGLDLVATGPFRFLLSFFKAQAHLALDEREQAIATVDDVLSVFGLFNSGGMADLLAMVGKTDDSRAILSQLENQKNPNSTDMALAYRGNRDFDQAFRWLHRTIDDRRGAAYPLFFLRTSPVWDEMRRDPRWQEVMQHLEQEEAQGRERNRTRQQQAAIAYAQ